MGYRAVIFDLDGVLVFTDRFHYEAWKAIADKLSIPFNEEDNNRLRGVSRRESLELLLAKGGDTKNDTFFSEEEKQEMMEEKNEIYRRLLDTMTKEDVSEEVRNTLQSLREKGLHLAVGSSSKNTPFILEKTALDGVFDQVADGNCITRSKPDPEVFLKAAELLGEKPQDCLVVEDAEAGIIAATAAGMDSAAIGDAATCGRSTYILEHFSDLLQYA